MNYKNVKKLIAAAASTGMLLGAVAVTGNYEKSQALAEEANKGSVTLAIAGDEDNTEGAELDDLEKGEVELATEDEGNGKVVLETTGSDEKEENKEKDEKETEEKETEEKETAAETEKKVEHTQLETTATGLDGISAIDVSGVVEKTMPSIVAITTKSVSEVQSYYYGPQTEEQEGAGSGVIIAQNGDELLIATNNHVVADTTELTVCFTVDAEDQENLLAKAVVKGTSPKNDLAVVAVKLDDINEDVLKQLRIATLGNSDKLKVGEAAIVIGNALGSGQTVTTGIISALEREVVTETGTFTEFQTDAAVNLGCSGGAILNAKGEVIGITSAKATGDYAESMGYGIPVSTAIPILQDLINRETRDVVENHGYMGITVVPVSEEAMSMYNMPAGAFVYEVAEDSAAEKAGLKKGDIITKFDGIEIDSSDTLVSTMSYYNAGETVKVEYQVNESGAYVTKETEVTLQEGTKTVTDNEEAKTDDDKKDEQNDDQLVPEQDGQQNGSPDLNQYNGQDEYNNGQGGYDQYMNPWQFFFGNGFGGNGGF